MKNRDKLAYQAFAERFKTAVKRSGMTQAKIADLSGITEVSISRYCNGDRLPGPYVIDRLCTVFGCSADWLIGRMEMPHSEVVHCNDCKYCRANKPHPAEACDDEDGKCDWFELYEESEVDE